MAHLAVSLPNITVERYGADIIGPLFHIQHALVNPIDCSVGHLTVPDRPGLGAELDMHKRTSSVYRPFQQATQLTHKQRFKI